MAFEDLGSKFGNSDDNLDGRTANKATSSTTERPEDSHDDEAMEVAIKKFNLTRIEAIEQRGNKEIFTHEMTERQAGDAYDRVTGSAKSGGEPLPLTE